MVIPNVDEQVRKEVTEEVTEALEKLTDDYINCHDAGEDYRLGALNAVWDALSWMYELRIITQDVFDKLDDKIWDEIYKIQKNNKK